MLSLDLIQKALSASLDGMTVQMLLAQYPTLSRRTLQRHLAAWVDQGILLTKGEGRVRRYCLPQHQLVMPASVQAPLILPTHAEFGAIPISADSADVLTYVRRPLIQRQPVGYQSDFLHEYEPNQTHYLPAAMRSRLFRLGQTPHLSAPAGTYSRGLLNRLLIDLSWASSLLEGNTYSRLDTRNLLELGQVASGKAASETQMLLNHKSAIEFLVGNVDTIAFNRYTLLNLHSLLSENLLPNPMDEGRIRLHSVEIGQSVYRPLGSMHEIGETLDQVLLKASQIEDPFEQSFFMMVHLPYLQPFADINKRTSRLAANIPMFKANLCPLTFLDVPESAYSLAMLGVYELTRIELLRDLYVWAYERSCREYLAIRQELIEPDPLRLAWRDLVRQTLQSVIRNPQNTPIELIEQHVENASCGADTAAVRSMIIDELSRLHEGVLARYGLRLSEYERWRDRHAQRFQ